MNSQTYYLSDVFSTGWRNGAPSTCSLDAIAVVSVHQWYEFLLSIDVGTASLEL